MTSMNPKKSTSAPASSPTFSGYADVNGLHLYYEEHDGQGGATRSPLVLLHGGMLSIDLSFADLIPRLTPRHRVIAVELQGHGRTADIEHTISPANSASDVVGVLATSASTRRTCSAIPWAAPSRWSWPCRTPS